MPCEDRARIRDLMRDVVRLPIGDDVMPARVCKSLQASYAALRPEGRLGFLSILARQDVDEEAVRHGCQNLIAATDGGRGPVATSRARALLRDVLRPASERILERLSQQEDGLRFLIQLRTDLLTAMESSAPLQAKAPTASQEAPSAPPAAADDDDAAAERELWRSLDGSLRRTLGLWFDAGLLELRQLTWEHTPAALLAKLMAYERVHRIDGWADLHHRLSGPGRRLYAFAHPRMPGEPLVFVQCCVRGDIPSKLAQVLPAAGGEKTAAFLEASPPPSAALDSASTSSSGTDDGVAVFYSISSPFSGLRGVPLGGLLIKQVLATLTAEQRGIHTFVTLSPVPGFRSWLEARLARHAAEQQSSSASAADFVKPDEARALDRYLAAVSSAGLSPLDLFEARETARGADEADRFGPARHALLALCARYLCLAKKRTLALDPVAGFHLRNGATLHAIHPDANPSVRGLRESAGIMVNYLYAPERLEANHSAYVSRGEVQASERVWSLVEQGC